MADYISKQNLIADIERKLREILTVTELEKTQTAILSVLNGYDVSRKEGMMDTVTASRDFVQMFLDAKTVEGRSDKTIAHYQYILNKYFQCEKVTAQETTAFHIRDYFKKEKDRGISDCTIAGIRDVFNSFFGWLYNEGLIARNPCANVGTVKQEKKVRKGFTTIEIEKMLQQCSTLREKAIVLFFLNTGCRVSEVCGLCVSDIDTEKRDCLIYGKGKKERMVYFDEKTAWVLERYLKRRRIYKPTDPLFVDERENRMTPDQMRKELHDLEARCGVTDIHPHRFRRTFATNMINRDMPIQEVSILMGHEKIDTTMGYYAQSRERTRAVYDRYST